MIQPPGAKGLEGKRETKVSGVSKTGGGDRLGTETGREESQWLSYSLWNTHCVPALC